MQALTAKAGKVLGYKAVAGKDEQGTVYLVDMFGREHELEECQPPSEY